MSTRPSTRAASCGRCADAARRVNAHTSHLSCGLVLAACRRGDAARACAHDPTPLFSVLTLRAPRHCWPACHSWSAQAKLAWMRALLLRLDNQGVASTGSVTRELCKGVPLRQARQVVPRLRKAVSAEHCIRLPPVPFNASLDVDRAQLLARCCCPCPLKPSKRWQCHRSAAPRSAGRLLRCRCRFVMAN